MICYFFGLTHRWSSVEFRDTC